MLGSTHLDQRERRELERKHRLIKERLSVLQAALKNHAGTGISIPKETLMAQRMYLKMMQTKLERIESRLHND